MEFRNSKTAAGKTLQDIFPGLKLIFPTAKKRRARWYNRAFINQWFDNVPVNEQDRAISREQVEWQLEGLRETADFLRPLVEAEVEALGARNVFVGGLSQGCAMGLHLLVSYQGGGDGVSGGAEREALGGFVGMSGWLPFAADMEEVIHQGDQDGATGDDDLFASDDTMFESNESTLSKATRVCNLARDNMDLPSIETAEPLCLRTPVFLGHGRNDEKVKMELGLQAAGILRDVGMQVTWKEYDEGHWYKVPEEIDDIVEFLHKRMESCKS